MYRFSTPLTVPFDTAVAKGTEAVLQLVDKPEVHAVGKPGPTAVQKILENQLGAKRQDCERLGLTTLKPLN